MKAFPMHPSVDAISSACSFVLAGLSTATIWIAQAVDSVPPQARGWMELGGTIGLIGGLSYGIVTLWKELQNQKRDTAELNKEIREDWKKQNDKLIAVLEKLDPDGK